MTDILSLIGARHPDQTRRRTFEQRGDRWQEVTRLGKATARRTMRPDEVRRINPIEPAA